MVKRKSKKSPAPKSCADPKVQAPKDALREATFRARRTQIKKHAFVITLLVFGGLVSGTALAAALLSLKAISVSHVVKLNGTLQAVDQSTPVKHLTGGVVNNIFVTEGEVVREGQILLSLGTQDIDNNYDSARKRVSRLLVQLHCNKAMTLKRQQFKLPQELRAAMGRLDQVEEFRRATRKCQADLQNLTYQDAQARSALQLAQDEANLHERLAQADYSLRNKLRTVQNSALANLESIRDLNGLKESLKHELDAAKANARLARIKQEQGQKEQHRLDILAAHADAISDQLVEAERDLTRIERLRKDRFVYANTSGRVQRLRIKKAGGRIAAGAYVLEIAPLTTDFEVLATLGAAEMPDIAVGLPVQVKLSGGMPRPIWVPAKVAKLTTLSSNRRLVSIRLGREDLNKRDLLLGDFSLNGLGEQSEALISVSSENAAGSLRKILFQHLWSRPSTEI